MQFPANGVYAYLMLIDWNIIELIIIGLTNLGGKCPHFSPRVTGVHVSLSPFLLCLLYQSHLHVFQVLLHTCGVTWTFPNSFWLKKLTHTFVNYCVLSFVSSTFENQLIFGNLNNIIFTATLQHGWTLAFSVLIFIMIVVNFFERSCNESSSLEIKERWILGINLPSACWISWQDTLTFLCPTSFLRWSKMIMFTYYIICFKKKGRKQNICNVLYTITIFSCRYFSSSK